MRSRILIVTPASAGSRKGNRVTADRWARILRSIGHRVDVRQTYQSESCHVLVALHARRSASSIRRFARRQPDKPIIVALTGTDLYHDIHHSQTAQHSLEYASRLVILQPDGATQLPRHLCAKARVIYQSAEALRPRPTPLKHHFEICVTGHLRTVKDPFRTAMAARRLPADSTIRITHVGAALTDSMRRRAMREGKLNRRYHWMSEVPRSRATRLLARSRLMVLSSRMEGGANVISEAIVAGVPILASRISGTLGLLGDDYPGYFEVGDTAELARLMYRAEQDVDFYRLLRRHGLGRRALFAPQRERNAWRRLLHELPLPGHSKIAP